jgi:DNA-binding beta-propeller fold protein YncE
MSSRIEYTAPESVQEVVASLGRTEDLRVSPNGRRLAVAGFARDRITVFGVEISSSASGSQVALTDSLELSSAALKRPHGVAFIDDDSLIVTSREGTVDVFTLPAGTPGGRSLAVQPAHSWPAGSTGLLRGPSAVFATTLETGSYEILVCNNDAHTVTRHLLDKDLTGVGAGEVMMEEWLATPDGVTVSQDRQWIAVSNHGTQDVLLFRASQPLTRHSCPEGILRGARFPHGLRFSGDGRHLFVADAEAPHFHIYAQDADEWAGLRYPIASVRVMDDDAFARGHDGLGDGGPKGLDVNTDSTVLVASCKCQPLAFFDVAAMLREVTTQDVAASRRERDFAYELTSMDQRRRIALELLEVEGFIRYLKNSKSWRATSWLRRLDSSLRRRPPQD